MVFSGPTVVNITVWYPATCHFAVYVFEQILGDTEKLRSSRTSNCSTYGNTRDEPGIFGSFSIKCGDRAGDASTVDNVSKSIQEKVLSMICS